MSNKWVTKKCIVTKNNNNKEQLSSKFTRYIILPLVFDFLLQNLAHVEHRQENGESNKTHYPTQDQNQDWL